MLTIANLPTQDKYTDALTLGPVQSTKLIKYVVANASVFARIWPQSKSGTPPALTDELLITPETNIITDAMGIQFRSAVAGTPAQVIAQLLEEGDPLIGGGTPFTATISSTGGVTPGGGVGADGWTSIGTILALSSAADAAQHTWVVSTNADLTGTVPVGAKVKFTQDATTKYFIVTALTAAAMTLYGGTDYSVSGNPITAVNYSVAFVPFGFNPSPAKWTEAIDLAQLVVASPVATTWYNVGSLTVPIGAWRLRYAAIIEAYRNNNSFADVYSTLTPTNGTEIDSDFTSSNFLSTTGLTVTDILQMASREKVVSVSAKTPYYLNIMTRQTGQTQVSANGPPFSTNRIEAVCAYL